VAVALSGNYAYIATGSSGFQVLDLSDPTRLKMIGRSLGGGYGRGIAVSGRFVYVTDALSGVQVYDVIDPTRPRPVGGNSALDAYGIAVSGCHVFAAGGSSGLGAFDLFTPPLRLEALPSAIPGNVDLRVDGPAGAIVRVQHTADLRLWQDWQTVTLGEVPKIVSDSTNTGEPQRYYRLTSP